MFKRIMMAAIAVIFSCTMAMAACNKVCRSKCDATWEVGGFASVEYCYAKWSKINAQGKAHARQVENANRARGWRRH